MKRCWYRSLIPLVVVLALGVFLGGSSPAAACNCFCDSICEILGDCCFPGCGGDRLTGVTVRPLPDNQALILFNGGHATEMAVSASCLVGFPVLDEIAFVESVEILDAATGAVLHTTTASELAIDSVREILVRSGAKEIASGDWLGFVGTVAEDVPDGTRTQFALQVTLQPGTSYRELAKALQLQGHLVGGAANPDGTSDFHHYFVRNLGAAHVEVESPRGVFALVPNGLEN